MTARPAAMLAAALLVAVAARAQEERTVQVHVTSVSGRDVYLDAGRAAGIAAGQVVLLFPPGTPSIEATVRTVSGTSSRAEMQPGVPPPPVGTRGEIRVPAAGEPEPAPSPDPPTRPPPSHPPWSRPADPRRPDDPLLVPTFGQRPDERPFRLEGRVFGSVNWSRDEQPDHPAEYALSRVGVRAEGTNALGAGERILLDAEVDDRRALLSDEPDEVRDQARIDLLSIAFGTEGWAPVGVEAGRFLPVALPEIGLLDGVEAVLRTEGGLVVGAGAGAYPLPFPDREAGDDLGAHVFLDYAADEHRSFAGTVGLQKTWHEGEPDRDLLLLRVEGRLGEDVWLYASAKVDFYTSSDVRKDSMAEITEFLAQARWDSDTVGTGATVSHFTWPDLQRQEYQDLPDELVTDGVVDRGSLSAWLRPAKLLRLSVRGDVWQDQDRDGTGFEVAADWTNVLRTGANLSVQGFATQGGTQSGPGLRVTASRQFGDVWIQAGYRWYDYELSGLLGGPESLVRQSIEAGVSWAAGDFDFDLQAERWFGDQEDSWAVGLYAQWRF